MRVMGVDPGSLKSGYGIIDEQQGNLVVIEYGVIQTTPHVALPQRLLEIGTRLQELIAHYLPQELAIEDVFVAKNAKSSLKLGQARGSNSACGSAGRAAHCRIYPLRSETSCGWIWDGPIKPRCSTWSKCCCTSNRSPGRMMPLMRWRLRFVIIIQLK